MIWLIRLTIIVPILPILTQILVCPLWTGLTSHWCSLLLQLYVAITSAAAGQLTAITFPWY